MTDNEIDIYAAAMSKISQICEYCGTKKYVCNKDFSICRVCGERVYKNEKLKFKYELKKRMRR